MDFITKGIIKRAFDEQLVFMFHTKPSVLKFIRNHERKNLCLENLVNEIERMEIAQPALLKKEHIEMLGREYARTFSHAALKLAEEEAMHYLDKQEKIDEARQIEEIMNMFDSEDKSEQI